MWNMGDNFDVECSRERRCGMWWRTFDVEYSGERWCEIWWITLMWNAPENGDVKYGGER